MGVSTLGVEIAAARLLAPFSGASTVVWANTIATVLVALSIATGSGEPCPTGVPGGGICRRVLVGARHVAVATAVRSGRPRPE